MPKLDILCFSSFLSIEKGVTRPGPKTNATSFKTNFTESKIREIKAKKESINRNPA